MAEAPVRERFEENLAKRTKKEKVDERAYPDLSVSIVQAFVAKVGYDICTITGTLANPHLGRIQWGTATGVYSSGLQVPVASIMEIQPDGSIQYRLTFTLTNMQQQAATNYFAQIVFDDNSVSPEITWLQTALNSSPNDHVHFYSRVLTDFAAVKDICTRASTRGWLSADEWTGLRNLVINTAWYNYVDWNDGR